MMIYQVDGHTSSTAEAVAVGSHLPNVALAMGVSGVESVWWRHIKDRREMKENFINQLNQPLSC